MHSALHLILAAVFHLPSGDPTASGPASSQAAIATIPREVRLTIECDGFRLPAILTLPRADAPQRAAAGRVPAIVLVHGSGAHDADETQGANRPFRDLADGLAAKGIATLRYEKRTLRHGAAIDPASVTLEWETINDAAAAVRLARSRPEVDPRRVFVLGHSMGGLAAPFVAEREPDVAGLVLMAANARPLVELIEEQFTFLSRLDGVEGRRAAIVLKRSKPTIDAIRSGGPLPAGATLLGAPAEYWAGLSKHDGPGAAARFGRPILVLAGGRDYLVTDKDYAVWRERLASHPAATFKRYDRMNHNMIAGDAAPGPADDATAGKVDDAVIADIAAWIKH